MDKSLTSVAALWLGAEPPDPPVPERDDVDIEDANADDQDSKPRLPVALSLAWHVWPLWPQDRAMCPSYTDHGVEYTEHDKPAAWCRSTSECHGRHGAL